MVMCMALPLACSARRKPVRGSRASRRDRERAVMSKHVPSGSDASAGRPHAPGTERRRCGLPVARRGYERAASRPITRKIPLEPFISGYPAQA